MKLQVQIVFPLIFPFVLSKTKNIGCECGRFQGIQVEKSNSRIYRGNDAPDDRGHSQTTLTGF